MYTFFEKTIIDGIDFTDYDLSNDMYLYDKLKTVYNIFKIEFVGDHNKHKDETTLFTDWLRGLPSVLYVPYYNNDILESAKAYGLKVTDEDKFIENYFNNLAKAFFDLKENL